MCARRTDAARQREEPLEGWYDVMTKARDHIFWGLLGVRKGRHSCFRPAGVRSFVRCKLYVCHATSVKLYDQARC